MKIKIIILIAGAWSLAACAGLPHMADTHDPLSPTEHVSLGDAYMSHDEKAPAIQQYQSALNEDRHCVLALLALGNMAFDDSDWKRARSYFERAVQTAPQNAGAINNLAMVDLAEGKHLDHARQQLNQALPMAGLATPYLLDTLANIAIRENRYSDAGLALAQAQASAPANDADFSKHLQETRLKLAEAVQTAH